MSFYVDKGIKLFFTYKRNQKCLQQLIGTEFINQMIDKCIMVSIFGTTAPLSSFESFMSESIETLRSPPGLDHYGCTLMVKNI